MLWREGDLGAGRVWRGREREAGGMGEGRGRPEAYGKELWSQGRRSAWVESVHAPGRH